MAYQVFVDTNILLDFYRIRGQEKGLSILNHFDGNHGHLITTYQVEMEYKKNRQRVILESLQAIKTSPSSSDVPAFLKESQPQKMLKAAEKQLRDQARKLRDRTARLLNNPSQNDPVYQTLQRLFKADKTCHLTRTSDEKEAVREAAAKRFWLGYPPRKATDTSMGDAINWEWIVHCAKSGIDDVVIVSRDSDYGAIWDGEAYLNDWLKQEFQERVSKKRTIMLTTRLTEAFKVAGIRVSSAEEQEEERLIRQSPPRPNLPEGGGINLVDILAGEP